MNLSVNRNWNFEQAVKNIRALRNSYEEFLCSFSYFQKHEKVKFKKNFHDEIYSLDMEEWQRDKLWDYLNRNIFYYDLKQTVEYLRNKGRKSSKQRKKSK